ncbi:MAG TPA: hypothetical protein VLT86_07020 [Vicinamibacterales bacterium]|nr:hypothetical protein [Vicinamibacterales bacterium]
MPRSTRRRPTRTRRGRPHKYGRPSKVVALTLPIEVIEALRASHSDLGWAVVKLVEKAGGRAARPAAADFQLVEVGAGASLIVVDPASIERLPAVQIVPLSDHEAFLALAPGRGMADLEIAVVDQMERLRAGTPERRAAERLRQQLRAWRKDSRLTFESRSIILVTRNK